MENIIQKQYIVGAIRKTKKSAEKDGLQLAHKTTNILCPLCSLPLEFDIAIETMDDEYDGQYRSYINPIYHTKDDCIRNLGDVIKFALQTIEENQFCIDELKNSIESIEDKMSGARIAYGDQPYWGD